MSTRCQAAYEQLQAYTLSLGDPAFLHQHVVDTWTAQQADSGTKPIALTFALAGLYLHLERGLSGRQVQRVHTLLARRKRPWPSFPLPAGRGAITALDVMTASAGPERDGAIEDWCASVWSAYHEARPALVELLRQHGIG